MVVSTQPGLPMRVPAAAGVVAAARTELEALTTESETTRERRVDTRDPYLDLPSSVSREGTALGTTEREETQHHQLLDEESEPYQEHQREGERRCGEEEYGQAQATEAGAETWMGVTEEGNVEGWVYVQHRRGPLPDPSSLDPLNWKLQFFSLRVAEAQLHISKHLVRTFAE